MAKAGAENNTERRNAASRGSPDTDALLTAHRRGEICEFSAMESMANLKALAVARRTESRADAAIVCSAGPK